MACATSARRTGRGRRPDHAAMDRRKEFVLRFLRSGSVDNRESSRGSASKYPQRRSGIASSHLISPHCRPVGLMRKSPRQPAKMNIVRYGSVCSSARNPRNPSAVSTSGSACSSLPVRVTGLFWSSPICRTLEQHPEDATPGALGRRSAGLF